MVNLNEFIHVDEGHLEPTICDYLIETFETNKDKHQRVDKEKKPSFTYVNLTENQQLTNQTGILHQHIVNKIIQKRDEYYDAMDCRVFPEDHSFEHLKIIRYNNDGNDAFNAHVDTYNENTSKRFLGFIWFLNDVENGGELQFRDKTIYPTKGRLVIFPSTWTFPYKENEPVDRPKYIITSYLHYN
jgi:prolyl 4-hydroxylase